MTKDNKKIRLPCIKFLGQTNRWPAEVDIYMKKAIKEFNKKGYETYMCCSGHTCFKHWWENSEAWVIFTKDYSDKFKFIDQRLINGTTRIQVHHCSTLMGIKKACRKLYRFAKSLDYCQVN